MPLPRSILRARHHDIDLKLTAGAWPDDISGEMVISAPGATDGLAHTLFSPGHMIRLSMRPGTNGAAADRFARHRSTSRTARDASDHGGVYILEPIGLESTPGRGR